MGDVLTPEGAFLDEVKAVLRERRESYGPAEAGFTRMAGLWGAYLGVPLTAQDVAAMMILFKVARHRGGGCTHKDNLVDICGYTALAAALGDTTVACNIDMDTAPEEVPVTGEDAVKYGIVNTAYNDLRLRPLRIPEEADAAALIPVLVDLSGDHPGRGSFEYIPLLVGRLADLPETTGKNWNSLLGVAPGKLSETLPFYEVVRELFPPDFDFNELQVVFYNTRENRIVVPYTACKMAGQVLIGPNDPTNHKDVFVVVKSALPRRMFVSVMDYTFMHTIPVKDFNAELQAYLRGDYDALSRTDA